LNSSFVFGGIKLELIDFRKEFLEEVKSQAVTEMDFERASFVTIAAQKLIEAEELEDFEPCYYEGTGKRNRKLQVNGYSFDDVDDSVKLLISYYNGEDTPKTLTQTEAGRLFDRLRFFVEESLAGSLHPQLEESSPGYGLASELYHRRESIRCFKFFLVTDAVLSSRVKDLSNNSLGEKPIEYSIWDITRFHRVFESQTGKEDLQIDFREFIPEGIPCLEASQAEGEYKAYLCVIPGNVLADIYDLYGSRLLEGNVRSFLSTKGKVNKGIKSTIIREPEMFFAYNNGIAATATDAEVLETSAGLRLIQSTDLQIVNGGQTTASLLMAKLKDKADLTKIFVQMKLSVISSTKAESIIPEIARCANSQNKVSDADFFSNHPFHIRIESISRRIWAPAVGGAQHETHWFYERARGQYLNQQGKMTQSEKRRFLNQNPRTQLITKTDLAKYHNAWRGFPHTVSLGAQKNFRFFADWIAAEWEKSDTDFNEEFFKESVALAIIFRHTERLVSGQPWYQGGYRANIVAYSVAKLASMIKSSCQGKVLDLRRIWNRQAVSNTMNEQLKIIAEAVFDKIVAPESGYQNVTEWCKKERCWDIIKNLDLPILEGFQDDLTDIKEIKAATRISKNQQKLDNGIEAQIRVLEAGADYWYRLTLWAQERHLITPEEEKLLRVATKVSPGIMPTDKQSIKLLMIKERVVKEGFAG
jgi:hypothetical protein